MDSSPIQASDGVYQWVMGLIANCTSFVTEYIHTVVNLPYELLEDTVCIGN